MAHLTLTCLSDNHDINADPKGNKVVKILSHAMPTSTEYRAVLMWGLLFFCWVPEVQCGEMNDEAAFLNQQPPTARTESDWQQASMAGPSGAAAVEGDPRLLALGGLALLATLVGAGAVLWLNRRSTSTGQVVGRVTSIVVYPVKSARGIQVDASLVEQRGLLFDRLWMVVTDSGRFKTQRQIPKMSQIQPRLPGGMAEVRALMHG